MSSLELIIAHYEEDLAWLRKVPSNFRRRIYSKSVQTHTSSFPESIALPNVGRESHTYLTHIVQNYETLSELNVFCQGHPFDHCSTFHPILKNLSAYQTPFSKFEWLGFIIDWDNATGTRLFQNWSKNEEKDSLKMEQFCELLFNEKSPEPYVFYPGAQFIVTRETIQTRPIEFYIKALALAETFPHAAHCFERVWDRVFQVNGVTLELRKVALPHYLKPIRRLSRPL